ncbi:MAG: MFS transporter [Armatimonadota bacterium]
MPVISSPGGPEAPDISPTTVGAEVDDHLRRTRGPFAAMIATYSLDVFNDQFFKESAFLLAVAAGISQTYIQVLFMLPFVLFASQVGWMADRFPKRSVVFMSKLLELAAVLLGAGGLLLGNWSLLLAATCLLGLRGAMFNPALNGSIPEVYPAEHVTRANGILKIFVTAAMLAGVALSGPVLEQAGTIRSIPLGHVLVAGGILLVAILGLVASQGMAHRPAARPEMPFPTFSVPRPIQWILQRRWVWLPLAVINVVLFMFWVVGPQWPQKLAHAGLLIVAHLAFILLVKPAQSLIRVCRDRLLGVAIGANTFFWFLASLQVMLINKMGLEQFHFTKTETSLLAGVEMIGVAIGGLLCARWAVGTRWHRVLAPAALTLGVVLMLTFGVPVLPDASHLGALMGLLGIAGIAGGLFMVPLESFIQVRPAAGEKGSVISTANSAIFTGMLLAGVAYAVLEHFFTAQETTSFAIAGVMAVVVGVWLTWVLPRVEG